MTHQIPMFPVSKRICCASIKASPRDKPRGLDPMFTLYSATENRCEPFQNPVHKRAEVEGNSRQFTCACIYISPDKSVYFSPGATGSPRRELEPNTPVCKPAPSSTGPRQYILVLVYSLWCTWSVIVARSFPEWNTPRSDLVASSVCLQIPGQRHGERRRCAWRRAVRHRTSQVSIIV